MRMGLIEFQSLLVTTMTGILKQRYGRTSIVPTERYMDLYCDLFGKMWTSTAIFSHLCRHLDTISSNDDEARSLACLERSNHGVRVGASTINTPGSKMLRELVAFQYNSAKVRQWMGSTERRLEPLFRKLFAWELITEKRFLTCNKPH
uniref:Uncharacterized protein n=1 Tax=Grammatophora oceanica TaxID=210454 RepID=A0A6U5H2Q2_9STRA|mmetsp:Transcript_16098/g.23801  ORF Transcript_16098/g.23801 Transcript_16098/m.23801 type:complete len:148 (+) Transcript_16098:142-585(+)